MCNPMAIGAAITVGSALLQSSEQGKAAKAGEQAANKAADSEHAALNEAAKEQAMATAEQMNTRARMAMEDQARLRVVAGENGVSSTTVAGLSQDIEAKTSADMATMVSNLGMKNRQTTLEMQGVESRRQSRLNNIKHPDWIGTGLQIAGTVTKAYGSGAFAGSSSGGSGGTDLDVMQN